MEFTDIQKLVIQGKYHYSSHADGRMAERGINDQEAREAIFFGDVLEIYSDDSRGKAYLVLGNRPVHVLVGYNKYRELAVIVTAYVPEPPKWKNPRERG